MELWSHPICPACGKVPFAATTVFLEQCPPVEDRTLHAFSLLAVCVCVSLEYLYVCVTAWSECDFLNICRCL